MKRFFTISLFLILGIGISNAQPKIKEILHRLPDRELPFVGLRDNWEDSGATGVWNEDGKIIDHLYTNVQLTEWSNAGEHDAERPTSCYQFMLPGHPDNCLLMIAFGGITDWQTFVLLSVTSEGIILDQMPVAVWGSTPNWTPVMQFEITAEGKIIVYRLVPTSTESIPLFEMPSFTAHRVDKTYTVDSNGKFRLVSTQQYVPKTYTAEGLSDPSYNIWSGGERPIRPRPLNPGRPLPKVNLE